MDINIRFVENNDYLWLKEQDNHISEKILRKKIENIEILVMENNGKIMGWLRYNLFWDNIPFMNMIYFLEEYRKIGLGKKLVEFWENERKNNGYRNVLTSTQSNEEAQHFYRKLGYIEIGGFKYFNDPYEIMFHKILS